MQAIGPAANPAQLSTGELRRRLDSDDISPNRAPPPAANDQGLGGRPIQPAAAAYDPAALGADAPPKDEVLEQRDAAPPAPELDLRDPDDPKPAPYSSEPVEEPEPEIPTARLEVVNVQGRLGAPITAYDNSKSPPTLVIYV